MRIAVAVEPSDEELATLEKSARSHTTQVRLAQRAKAILLAAQGLENQAIAEQVDLGRVAVGRWRNRFAERRLAGIEKDAPRGGRMAGKRQYWAPVIVDTTLHMLPANGTHWSTRTLADTLGIDRSMVQRVWKANNLKPNLVKTFMLSNHPHFVDKLVDVVGYVRHGTTTLIAALNVADGKLIGACMQQHRHHEWRRFLKLIDKETPKDLDLRIIADNHATRKHAKVKASLANHPRFHMHFTPTSAS